MFPLGWFCFLVRQQSLPWYPKGKQDESVSKWGPYRFSPSYGPATTHEHQGYHMDIEDWLAVTFSLVGKIIHKDCQANFLAA